MCEKLNKVNQWLRSVFGEQPVPPFEVNTRTVDILYQLAETSKARCSATTQLINDLNHKAAEYQADAAHLEDVLLQGVGLTSASLSKPAADYASALVDSAMVLGIENTSLSSFIPAINRQTNELLEAEKDDRRLNLELKSLNKRLGATVVLRKNLEEDIGKAAQAQQVASAIAEERVLTMDFVKKKTQELKFRRKRAADLLSSRNMEETLKHEAITQHSEEVMNLKKEIDPLKKKLEPYIDLSPNPSLAQVKVEEAKRELAALDARIEMNVEHLYK